MTGSEGTATAAGGDAHGGDSFARSNKRKLPEAHRPGEDKEAKKASIAPPQEEREMIGAFPADSLMFLPSTLWFEILDHFADDAISLARISMTSKGCQRIVFGSLRHVLRKTAPFSTAAPMSRDCLDPSDPRRRNDLVLPKPLFGLWWANKLGSDYDEANDDDKDYIPTDDNDSQGNDGAHSGDDDSVPTQYDRLEGLGYYQAVVRAGLLQKRRVITNDRFSPNRVPHSALRMERMLEILETGRFRRNKSLYYKNIIKPEGYQPPQPPFLHDCVNPPNYGGGGMAYCLAHFMVFEGIMPNFNEASCMEHISINAYPERRKYRECDLYQRYMATVPANFHYLPQERRSIIFNRIPTTLRLLVASDSLTLRW